MDLYPEKNMGMAMVILYNKPKHLNMKFLIILLPAILLYLTASAQYATDTFDQYTLLRLDSITTEGPQKHFMFNRFGDNWFASLSAGGQVYFGDEDGMKSLGEPITPTFEFSVGKWIHPVLAFRARVGGGKIKGYSTGTIPPIGDGYIVDGPDADSLYTQKWNQVFVDAEVMLDMSNIFGGYKRERFYSVITYVGAGMNFARHQRTKVDPDRVASFNAGIINRFRLGGSFDINIEFKGTQVNQTFDREQTLKFWEGYGAIVAGITCRIGKSGDRLFRKGRDTRTTVNRYYQTTSPAPAVVPPVAEVITKEVIIDEQRTLLLATPVAVFFELDKSVILNRAKVNINFVADVIKKSNGAKFRLIGSADSYTATPAYNQQLSMRRCEAVRDWLVNEYGVNPDQLILDPIGGIDRYRPPYVNRMVIIKQEEMKE